jgi:hypothetical protein
MPVNSYRDSSSWFGPLPDALLDTQYRHRHRVCQLRYSEVPVEVAGPGPGPAAAAVVLEVTPFSTRSPIKVVAGEGRRGEAESHEQL